MTKLIRKHWPLLIIILLGFLPLIWFKDGFLIAGGDNTIYVNPLITYGNFHFSWLDKIDLGRPNLIKSISFPLSFFWFIFYKTGLSLVNIQRFWMVLHFMLPGVSMYFLIRFLYDKTYSRGALAGLAGSLFYMINPFVMVDVLQLAQRPILAFFPLMFLFFIKGLDQKRVSIKYPGLIALCSVALGTANINISFILPVYFILFVYWLFYSIKSKEFVKSIFFLLITVIFILLVNLWWISDSFLGMLKSDVIIKAIRSYNFLDRTRISEAFRLMGFWAFRTNLGNMPLVPYALKYYQFPVIYITFLLPIFVFFSLIISSKKYITSFFSLLALIGIFLAKGINFPFGGIYQYLYDNMPGFSIFREPYYKFTIIHLIAFSVLIGFFAEDIFYFINSKVHLFFKKLVAIFVVIGIFFCILVSGYPLIFNKHIQDEKWHDNPHDSLYVKPPEAWKRVPKWFEENDPFSRVMVFPKTRYGQTYIWPKGIVVGDPPAEYLLPNPIVRSFSIPLIGQEILATLPYDLIAKNKDTDLFPYLDLLSIKYILQQDDVAPEETTGVLDVKTMKTILTGQKHLKFLSKDDDLNTYEVLKKLPSNLIYETDSLNYVVGNIGDYPKIFENYQYKEGDVFVFSDDNTDFNNKINNLISRIFITIKKPVLIAEGSSFEVDIPLTGEYQLFPLALLFEKIDGKENVVMKINGKSWSLKKENLKNIINLGKIESGKLIVSINQSLSESPEPYLVLSGIPENVKLSKPLFPAFKKNNPSEYTTKVINTGSPQLLIFNTTYNSQWELITPNKKVNSIHFLANGYSNGWILNLPADEIGKEYPVKILYAPQQYANVSLYISIITSVILFFILFIYKKSKFFFVYGKILLLSIFLLGTLIQLLNLQISNNIVFLIIFLSWFICVLFVKLSHRISLLFAITALAFCPVFLYFKADKLASESAVLSFLFLSFVIGQQMLILIKNKS